MKTTPKTIHNGKFVVVKWIPRYSIVPTATGGYWYVRDNSTGKSTGVVGYRQECRRWIRNQSEGGTQ